MRVAGLAAVLALVAHAFIASAAPLVVADDLGRGVTLAHPAQRIVSLSPFLTELAFSAGAGARVVGVSAYSDWPPAARALPQVASAAGMSLESIAALRPDLVLAWTDTTRPEDVARLERLGTAVFVARARRLDDPPRLLEAIARLAGTDASTAATQFRTRVETLRRRYASRPAVSALVEIWHAPLTTVGAGHWIGEALAACGARNAFADLPGLAPQVGWELVYQRDPQVIVATGSAGSENAVREQWRAHATLAAVRTGRIVFVDADLLERPTLRLAEGVARLCEGIERAR